MIFTFCQSIFFRSILSHNCDSLYLNICSPLRLLNVSTIASL